VGRVAAFTEILGSSFREDFSETGIPRSALEEFPQARRVPSLDALRQGLAIHGGPFAEAVAAVAYFGTFCPVRASGAIPRGLLGAGVPRRAGGFDALRSLPRLFFAAATRRRCWFCWMPLTARRRTRHNAAGPPPAAAARPDVFAQYSEAPLNH
jgi:hypothetical protein